MNRIFLITFAPESLIEVDLCLTWYVSVCVCGVEVPHEYSNGGVEVNCGTLKWLSFSLWDMQKCLCVCVCLFVLNYNKSSFHAPRQMEFSLVLFFWCVENSVFYYVAIWNNTVGASWLKSASRSCLGTECLHCRVLNMPNSVLYWEPVNKIVFKSTIQI